MTLVVHAVGVVYESPRGNILVLLRSDSVPEAGTWGLVGGKVAASKTAVETAVEKTKAEIGYDSTPSMLTLAKSYHWSREDLDLTFDVFRSSLEEHTPIRLDTAGNVSFRWATPDDIYAQPNLMAGLRPILEDFYGCKPAKV